MEIIVPHRRVIGDKREPGFAHMESTARRIRKAKEVASTARFVSTFRMVGEIPGHPDNVMRERMKQVAARILAGL